VRASNAKGEGGKEKKKGTTTSTRGSPSLWCGGAWREVVFTIVPSAPGYYYIYYTLRRSIVYSSEI
jgi:hypothetical protein